MPSRATPTTPCSIWRRRTRSRPPAAPPPTTTPPRRSTATAPRGSDARARARRARRGACARRSPCPPPPPTTPQALSNSGLDLRRTPPGRIEAVPGPTSPDPGDNWLLMRKIRLEPLDERHLEDVRALVADPDVLHYTRIPEPPPDDFAWS